MTALILLTACQQGSEATRPVDGVQDAQPASVVEETAPLQEPAVLPALTPLAVTPETPQPTETPIDEEAAKDSAADADVVFVRAVLDSDGSWTFHVTVQHPDTGWEDYADGWDVILPDGEVIKVSDADPFTRLLLHPHETEQPFTRSVSHLTIPDEFNQVTIRAHDIVSGYGGQQVTVDLLASEGQYFVVERP